MDAEFRFEDDIARGIRVLSPTAELDADTTRAICPFVAAALDAGVRHVIFDLTAVAYLDSSAIAALLQAADGVARKGCRLAVVTPPDSRIASIFSMTNVDQILPVVGTREAALRAA